MKWLISACSWGAILGVLFSSSTARSDPAGRIIGGSDVDIKDVPFQVALEVDGKFRCGGAILSRRFILTTAHCIKRVNKKELRVRVGSAKRESGGTPVAVVQIWRHPDFVTHGHTVDYDVATLELAQDLVFGSGVKPINLQPVGVDVQTGTVADVTGWGRKTSNGSFADNLQRTKLAKMDNYECVKLWATLGPASDEESGNGGLTRRITPRNTCYYAPYKSICYGDEGGPLVVDGKLVGLASYFHTELCVDPSFPSVFANISDRSLHNWITDMMKSYLPK